LWSPGPERGAQRRLVGRPQDDLGALGAEGVQRAGEQALDRLGDLGRARQRAVGLVEELQPLAALALGDVGAVGEEDGQQRHDKERERPRLGRDDQRGDEAEARVRDGDREVGREHVPELAEAQPALAERDRGADQRDAGRRAHLGADDDGDRQLRAPVGADGRHPVADQRGEADRQGELAEVEEQLDRRQPAVEQQRQRRSHHGRDHEVRAARQHEAEHERHVAQREGVGVAAELEVDDATLADQEAEGEPPPRDMRLVQRWEVADRAGEERDRGGPDREVEPPHRVHTAQRGTDAAPGPARAVGDRIGVRSHGSA